MPHRILGRSNLQVAPLCLGGNVFGWTADQGASFKVLDALTSAGLNFIDTADVYSAWVPGHQGGESETVIGNWLKRRGRRDDIVIATKVGMQMAPDRTGIVGRAYRAIGRASRCDDCRPITSICILRMRRCHRASRGNAGAFQNLIGAGKFAPSAHRIIPPQDCGSSRGRAAERLAPVRGIAAALQSLCTR